MAKKSKMSVLKKAVANCGKGGPGDMLGLSVSGPGATPKGMRSGIMGGPGPMMGNNFRPGMQPNSQGQGLGLGSTYQGPMVDAPGSGGNALQRAGGQPGTGIASLMRQNLMSPSMSNMKLSGVKPSVPAKMKAVKNAVGNPTKNHDSLDSQ